MFIPGNHDELARRYVGREFGGIVVANEWLHETADGCKLWITHGDLFDGVIQCAKWLAYRGDSLYGFILGLNRHLGTLRVRADLPCGSLSRFLKFKVKRAVGYITELENAVARVMREHGLQSHKRRRFRVATTDSKHAYAVAPNVLERDCKTTAPNQKWLADMTCVPTDEGWLYVALVLDLCARKLVGWAMSETMPQELTLAALDVALGWRDPGAGLPRHSDLGRQYAAKSFRKKLKARGITASMSRKGDC